MASQESINQLKKSCERVKRIHSALTEQISGFKEASSDVDSLLSIVQDLSALPLQHLTEKAVAQITQNIEATFDPLQTTGNFYHQHGNLHGDAKPLQVQRQILHTAVANLIDVASQWIPYLVHLGGEFPEGIEKIRKVATDTEDAFGNLENWIASKKGEIKDREDEVGKIVQATKEAAAEVTVARFTEQFDTEANSLAKQSKRWLYATSAFAACTIGAAIYSYIQFELLEGAGTGGILGYTLSKLSVIAVLLTGTLWCGRIYRALAHQVTINRHRALSLQTFQAFVKATDDPRVKDSVLMAATKTIFGTVPTGLVDQAQSGQDSNAQVVEVINSTARATRQAVGKASE